MHSWTEAYWKAILTALLRACYRRLCCRAVRDLCTSCRIPSGSLNGFPRLWNRPGNAGMLARGIFGSDFGVSISRSGWALCFRLRRGNSSHQFDRRQKRRTATSSALTSTGGSLGKPSVLNNVETYVNVPVIMLHGAEWYASIELRKARVPRYFALAGAVNNTRARRGADRHSPGRTHL